MILGAVHGEFVVACCGENAAHDFCSASPMVLITCWPLMMMLELD
jgi:hypothetical protein